MAQHYSNDKPTKTKLGIKFVEKTILSELNPEQLKAVTYDEGSMLVLAGAGSGKTKVLTTRIAWLVKNNKVKCNEILAVTFTNKAAKEMMYRVANLLKADTKSMWIGTFHSIALKLLVKHHAQANLPQHFRILDSQDQLNLLKHLIKEANLDEDRYAPKEMQRFINYQKEHGIRAKDLTASKFREQNFIDVYGKYEVACQKDGLVDFTELLLRSYELLSTHKNILQVYQKQFRHILVDEFQDTNELQYNWLKLLVKEDTCIFAVGDDDQSIYSFRGARVANMKSFLEDFHIKNPIRLEQNYRSTTIILEAANNVIGNNSDRIGKRLWTNNSQGEEIRLYEGYTEDDEAYFVADEIKSLQQKGIHLSEIAVLYRSNAQSRIFEQFFYTRGIPYRVYGGLRFFDRQEIKHTLSYLRLIVNENDNEAFLKVVNFPARGIGAKTIEILQNIALEKNLSLYQACAFLEGKSKVSLSKFTSLIELMQKETQGLSLSENINYIINASGIKAHYAQEKHTSTERLENLNELVNAVNDFNAENGEDPIMSFLAHTVLDSGDPQLINPDNAVQLMTVHASKGLEFKVIFLVGLEEGLFPHENCLDSVKELEEERRLMYVAITRSKELLYLVRACSRQLWGKRHSTVLSRFVEEIVKVNQEILLNISGLSQLGKSILNSYGIEQSKLDTKRNEKHSAIVNPETRTSRVEVSGMSLKIGDMVRHTKFGNGQIMHLNVEGSKMMADVFFVDVGTKTLDLNIAKIEKITNYS